MEEQIYNIRYKFKLQQEVKLLIDNLETFKRVEQYLLNRLYHWNSRKEFQTLDESRYERIKGQSCIHINYKNIGLKILSFSTEESFWDNIDVDLNCDNVDKFFNIFFNIKPTYSPKKIVKSL